VTLDTEEPCGKWMPRKKTRCARKPGHGGPCKTSEAMALAVRRKAESVRVNGRRRYPETKRRWRQAYKLWRYGLTKEEFGRLLTAQKNACGMCREPFAEGSPICVDHDHICCPGGEDVVRQVRSRTAVPVVQHCAGAHRAEVRAGPRVPGQPSRPARRVTLADEKAPEKTRVCGESLAIGQALPGRAGAARIHAFLRGQETGRFPLTETTFHSGLVSVTASVRT
jgi:hypothetical protein